MLMNHLEGNEFVNYAGSVVLSQDGTTSQHKIVNQKVDMQPIRFQGMPELPFGYFSMRCSWSYVETQQYYILYWPVQYNILDAKLHELNDERYEPATLS